MNNCIWKEALSMTDGIRLCGTSPLPFTASQRADKSPEKNRTIFLKNCGILVSVKVCEGPQPAACPVVVPCFWGRRKAGRSALDGTYLTVLSGFHKRQATPGRRYYLPPAPPAGRGRRGLFLREGKKISCISLRKPHTGANKEG